MNTLKNVRRVLPLLFAAAALVAMTHDKKAAAQTAQPTPVKQWSLNGAVIKNTIGAVKHELEDLAEEFPQRLARFNEAEVDEDSLRFSAGNVLLGVEFRYPLAPEDARDLDGTWRVYRLKDGKLLGTRSHASAIGGADAPMFNRLAYGILLAAQAQLLDYVGADTRGSTRDLDVPRYDGTLQRGEFYRTQISYDRRQWKWVTTHAPKVPLHHAGRIEWRNVGHFSRLYFDLPPGARVEVVFQVVAVNREQVTARRWNTTYACLIVGVEQKAPPPAEYLTLVAACKGVRGTMKRNLSFYFTFDVRRVVNGRFDEREFTVELSGTTANALLGALSLAERPWDASLACAPGTEIELTFEVPADKQTTGRPGLLQEFRVIE